MLLPRRPLKLPLIITGTGSSSCFQIYPTQPALAWLDKAKCASQHSASSCSDVPQQPVTRGCLLTDESSQALDLARESGDSIRDQVWHELGKAKYASWEQRAVQRQAEHHMLQQRLDDLLQAKQRQEALDIQVQSCKSFTPPPPPPPPVIFFTTSKQVCQTKV